MLLNRERAFALSANTTATTTGMIELLHQNKDKVLRYLK
jgi:hypothetical protein